MKIKILIIEDDRSIQEMWKRLLSHQFEIIQAFTIEQGEKNFLANPNIGAIAVAARVLSREINTIDLVRMFRRTFKGPIISTSKSPSLREKMMSEEFGCNYDCEKYELPAMICRIFDVSLAIIS